MMSSAWGYGHGTTLKLFQFFTSKWRLTNAQFRSLIAVSYIWPDFEATVIAEVVSSLGPAPARRGICI